MKAARSAATLALLATLAPSAQMHKVEKADTVTRAVGVYEFIGDPAKPRAARFTPVSLFIGGHFEDAAVYLARPIPFALDTGLRYELQTAGVRKQFLDLVAARNFAGSSAAAAMPFDDGWAGYGRIVPLPTPKASKLRANCGNAHVVQEVDNSRPRFGNKPADTPKPDPKAAKDDPCRQTDDEDRPEKVTLDDGPKDKNSPDPERPTLHRSPEATASNTGANGKPDKKKPKEPNATITQNGAPADDPDRPTIKHREAADDDPNALPPDPVELASREAAAKAAGKPVPDAAAVPATASGGNQNDTQADGSTITAGNTMGGGPVLRRGRISQPKDDAPPAAKPVAGKPSSTTGSATPAIAAPVLPPPRDSMVAVSDAKDRTAHDFSYHFASPSEKTAALQQLEAMAQAVLANPSLASDAGDAPHATSVAAPAAKPVSTAKPATGTSRPVSTAARRTTAATHTRAAAAHRAATPADVKPQLADEEMEAYQLYYSAPITYTFSARQPATATSPERYVTVVATTDAEGKIQPAFRTTTDAAHLDRIPRYRLIDVVDADATNRAELLMELRAAHSRQFALYRLLGNKPDQVFLSGSTML